MKGPESQQIQSLFGSIAKTYDKANDAMTLGLARSWRKKVVQWSAAQDGESVLDCATGTGDLAIEFKKIVGQRGSVIGTDFCQPMLDLAPAKAKKLNLEIQFELADTLQLPYPDQTFDIVSISYGLRNVEDPMKATIEMARVLKPGGRLMILETGQVQLSIISHGVEFYFKKIVPRVGGWISGHREAYEYLNTSSRAFPSGEDLCQLIGRSELFNSVEYKSLLFGASYIYKAIKKS